MTTTPLKQYYGTNIDEIQVGVDEVARGTLIGSTFAGAVILPQNLDYPEIHLIKDSKKLSKKKRHVVKNFIEKHALAYATASVECDEIDKINIRNAAFKAMHKAIDQIPIHFDRIIVDGNAFHTYISKRQHTFIPYSCVERGDNIFMHVAAASILAKCAHDDYIEKLCEENDSLKKYGLLTNAGYGTKAHYEALAKYGPSQYHRKSFNLHLN